MISAVMQLGSDQIVIEVMGENLFFADVGSQLAAPIEGLQLNKQGVIKEFPDLIDNSDWRLIAISRLKEHLKNMRTEDDRINYAIFELKKYGYIGLYKQKNGWRREKL